MSTIPARRRQKALRCTRAARKTARAKFRTRKACQGATAVRRARRGR